MVILADPESVITGGVVSGADTTVTSRVTVLPILPATSV